MVTPTSITIHTLPTSDRIANATLLLPLGGISLSIIATGLMSACGVGAEHPLGKGLMIAAFILSLLGLLITLLSIPFNAVVAVVSARKIRTRMWRALVGAGISLVFIAIYSIGGSVFVKKKADAARAEILERQNKPLPAP